MSFRSDDDRAFSVMASQKWLRSFAQGRWVPSHVQWGPVKVCAGISCDHRSSDRNQVAVWRHRRRRPPVRAPLRGHSL